MYKWHLFWGSQNCLFLLFVISSIELSFTDLPYRDWINIQFYFLGIYCFILKILSCSVIRNSSFCVALWVSGQMPLYILLKERIHSDPVCCSRCSRHHLPIIHSPQGLAENKTNMCSEMTVILLYREDTGLPVHLLTSSNDLHFFIITLKFPFFLKRCLKID